MIGFVPIQKVNEAYERVLEGHVHYRSAWTPREMGASA
jgi:D-arabinose 1-dehydrogenase-like Zn-dependent alcohol dehydrogenase